MYGKELKINAKLKEDKNLVLNRIMNSSKNFPISSLDFSIPDGRVRKIVHMLRLEGEPICTVSGGYYYAETSEDIITTMEYLGRLRNGLNQTLDKLSKVHCAYQLEEFHGGR